MTPLKEINYINKPVTRTEANGFSELIKHALYDLPEPQLDIACFVPFELCFRRDSSSKPIQNQFMAVLF